MTRLTNTKTIYQCTLACAFVDPADSRSMTQVWRELRPEPLGEARLPHERWGSVSFLQDVLVAGQFFSMSTASFDRAVNEAFEKVVGVDRVQIPSSRFLPAVALAADVFHDDGMTYVCVVGSRPDRRKYLKITHMVQDSTHVHVVSCSLIGRRGAKVLVPQSEGAQRSLGLRLFLVAWPDFSSTVV